MGSGEEREPEPGRFIIEELTDLVEEAVLQEFERIAERGGVLGAMETGYQRGKIQEESLYYEHKKHDGSLPIIGVNTFRNPHRGDAAAAAAALDRRGKGQADRPPARFPARHHAAAETVLERLRKAAIATRTCSRS